jgi:hypothetical protein
MSSRVLSGSACLRVWSFSTREPIALLFLGFIYIFIIFFTLCKNILFFSHYVKIFLMFNKNGLRKHLSVTPFLYADLNRPNQTKSKFEMDQPAGYALRRTLLPPF